MTVYIISVYYLLHLDFYLFGIAQKNLPNNFKSYNQRFFFLFAGLKSIKILSKTNNRNFFRQNIDLAPKEKKKSICLIHSLNFSFHSFPLNQLELRVQVLIHSSAPIVIHFLSFPFIAPSCTSYIFHCEVY